MEMKQSKQVSKQSEPAMPAENGSLLRSFLQMREGEWGLPVRPAKQALELFRAASTTLAQTFAREKGLFGILAELP